MFRLDRFGAVNLVPRWWHDKRTMQWYVVMFDHADRLSNRHHRWFPNKRRAKLALKRWLA